MPTIQTIEMIDAPPGKVWRILTDMDAYPDWNPFITEGSGELRKGGKLALRMKPPGGKAMKFKPTVTEMEPEVELRWVGRLLFKGLFDGEHWFSVEHHGTGTKLTQSEHFSGLLPPIMGEMLKKTEQGFEEMNAALKERAESE